MTEHELNKEPEESRQIILANMYWRKEMPLIRNKAESKQRDYLEAYSMFDFPEEHPINIWDPLYWKLYERRFMPIEEVSARLKEGMTKIPL